MASVFYHLYNTGRKNVVTQILQKTKSVEKNATNELKLLVVVKTIETHKIKQF